MYKRSIILDNDYINDNKKRGLKTFVKLTNKHRLPLYNIISRLLYDNTVSDNHPSISNYFSIPTRMIYHDAGLIASSINRYLHGFFIKGGFTRELCRVLSKIENNKVRDIDITCFDLKDLDIHLTSRYELDTNALIKEERRTCFILNMLINILAFVGCKIDCSNRTELLKINLKKNYHNTTLYDMVVKVGSQGSQLSVLDIKKEYTVCTLFTKFIKSIKSVKTTKPCSSDINTQIVFQNNNNKVSDFVCNQICSTENYYDDDNSSSDKYPVVGIKELCVDHMQKFSNLQKKKVIKILQQKKIPNVLIIKILSYLNFNTRKRTAKESSTYGLTLDKEAMSRCKSISSMSLNNVITQLGRDTTYFIGDCKEIGCIPKNKKTLKIIKNASLKSKQKYFISKYKWDNIWASNMSIYKTLLYRLRKIEKRKIKVINCCKSNNPNCLWYVKNNKKD